MDLMTILGVCIGSGVILFVLSTGNMVRFLLKQGFSVFMIS